MAPDAQESETPTSSSSSLLKERRFKLSRACDRCRRRRIKCDEGHPCQACLTANSSCTFEEPGKRTHPHKSKRTATLEDRMHHLETLIKAIPPAVYAAGGSLHQAIGPTGQPMDVGQTPSPIAPFSYPGVPPPSLHVFPLVNPSTHFMGNMKMEPRRPSFSHTTAGPFHIPSVEHVAEQTSKMSLSASYLYIDDEGYTRWQGETSGLPVLDLLVERHTPTTAQNSPETSAKIPPSVNADWFPDRQLRRTEVNPQALWRLITSAIVPELMDNLVQCYLSTSYYVLPFLHVPTFLADYGNPQKWAEPGFAAFIVAVCCLASRHMDDARVRADPNNGISAGAQWFELYNRIRTLPIADRPTLYNIQANLIAAVYAVGSGKLTKAAALIAEACTMCVDSGLHRSADNYDLFDPIEDETRKRTFWCVYVWDKQLGAHLGRPAILRLRDCDVGEPAPVDDEFITRDGVEVPPQTMTSRMSAFIVCLRIMVVLESVLDVPSSNLPDDSSFLARAASLLSGRRKFKDMREEEALLDDIHQSIPLFWVYTPDLMASDDTIRLTQAVRLHCAEQFVRLLVYRHRFSELVAERTSGPVPDDQTDAERTALISAHNSALQIVAANISIAKKGLMTYYGVHVIHQLTQAGRTLVAVLLCCKAEVLQHLIPPGLDALRSCIGLLRRFSSRYVCGLRSGDLMEEFCRLTGIPLETPTQDTGAVNNTRPPWIRPIRKKAPSGALSSRSDSPGHSSNHGSPEAFSPSDLFSDPNSLKTGMFNPGLSGPNQMSTSPIFSASSTNNSTYMDTPGMLQPGRMVDDPHAFMSAEMLAIFNDGGLDMNSLFSPEFLQAANASSPSQLENAGGISNHNMTPGPANSPFLKMNGMVTSPS